MSYTKESVPRDVAPAKKILLVGRSGNGKRSTISSIERATSAERTIIAVECPGVGDTGEDREEDIDIVINKVDRNIKDISANGSVKAIVHVLKYGVRFTKQEKDAVEDVKSVFGRAVFQMFGIILFTYGDLFDVDTGQMGGETFENWCAGQQGELSLLFREVNNRVVLFNNRTHDVEQLNEQFGDLYRCVSKINGNYTLTHFNAALKDRRSLIIREKARRNTISYELPGERRPLTTARFLPKITKKTKIIIGISVFLVAVAVVAIIVASCV